MLPLAKRNESTVASLSRSPSLTAATVEPVKSSLSLDRSMVRAYIKVLSFRYPIGKRDWQKLLVRYSLATLPLSLFLTALTCDLRLAPCVSLVWSIRAVPECLAS